MGVGLGDPEVLFLVGRQVDDVVISGGYKGLDGDHRALGQLLQGVYLVGPNSPALAHDGLAVLVQHRLGDSSSLEVVRIIGKGFEHLPIWRFDEAVWIDPGVGRQGTEQADVGAFRGFDGAYPAVVGEVNVPHVESGPLPG